jgi:hypothetical protein
LYVWLFRAKRESLSSRNNDILKKNIDILKLGERKVGSPMGWNRGPGHILSFARQVSPSTLRPHGIHASATHLELK